MLQDGMVAVTMNIEDKSFSLYMIRVDAVAEEPAA